MRYATISHDGRHAGRGGSGAVLGSKNIKAIAVRGKRSAASGRDPRELTALSRDLSKRSFGPATAKYRELGTATNLLTFNRFGTLPTRNFQSGTFEEAANLSPEELSVTHAQDARELRGLHDRVRAHLRARPTGGVRLEYESLFALGSLCGVGDPDAVLARVAPLRRARHRHDQRRRHDRVRDGVRRARLARRAVAARSAAATRCCAPSI